MQRITLQKSNLNPNFIGAWTIEPFSLCDEIISYFEAHKNDQHIGITAGGKNLDVKDIELEGLNPPVESTQR